MEATTTSARPYSEQGARLKKARKRARLGGVLKAAPRYGTTPRHLIRLENGEHKPGSDLLAAIARETGTTVASFGYPNGDDDEEDSLRTALRQALPVPQADALYSALVERLPVGDEVAA